MSRLTRQELEVACVHAANMRKAKAAKRERNMRALADAVMILEIDVSPFKGGRDGAYSMAADKGDPINEIVTKMGADPFKPDMLADALREICRKLSPRF